MKRGQLRSPLGSPYVLQAVRSKQKKGLRGQSTASGAYGGSTGSSGRAGAKSSPGIEAFTPPLPPTGPGILVTPADLTALGARWDREMDELLREGVLRYGGKWEKVSIHMVPHECTALEVEQRWQMVKETPVKGPWAGEEDSLLKILVDKYGRKKWSLIATQFPGRSGKQCRERWLNHLDDRVMKSAWTGGEDIVLCEAQGRLGNKWSEISKLLPGRAENAVKNRFNSIVTKRLAQRGGAGPLPLKVSRPAKSQQRHNKNAASKKAAKGNKKQQQQREAFEFENAKSSHQSDSDDWDTSGDELVYPQTSFENSPAATTTTAPIDFNFGGRNINNTGVGVTAAAGATPGGPSAVGIDIGNMAVGSSSRRAEDTVSPAVAREDTVAIKGGDAGGSDGDGNMIRAIFGLLGEKLSGEDDPPPAAMGQNQPYSGGGPRGRTGGDAVVAGPGGGGNVSEAIGQSDKPLLEDFLNLDSGAFSRSAGEGDARGGPCSEAAAAAAAAAESGDKLGNGVVGASSVQPSGGCDGARAGQDKLSAMQTAEECIENEIETLRQYKQLDKARADGISQADGSSSCADATDTGIGSGDGSDGTPVVTRKIGAVPTRKAAMQIEAGGGVDVREGQASEITESWSKVVIKGDQAGGGGAPLRSGVGTRSLAAAVTGGAGGGGPYGRGGGAAIASRGGCGGGGSGGGGGGGYGGYRGGGGGAVVSSAGIGNLDMLRADDVMPTPLEISSPGGPGDILSLSCLGSYLNDAKLPSGLDGVQDGRARATFSLSSCRRNSSGGEGLQGGGGAGRETPSRRTSGDWGACNNRTGTGNRPPSAAGKRGGGPAKRSGADATTATLQRLSTLSLDDENVNGWSQLKADVAGAPGPAFEADAMPMSLASNSADVVGVAHGFPVPPGSMGKVFRLRSGIAPSPYAGKPYPCFTNNLPPTPGFAASPRAPQQQQVPQQYQVMPMFSTPMNTVASGVAYTGGVGPAHGFSTRSMATNINGNTSVQQSSRAAPPPPPLAANGPVRSGMKGHVNANGYQQVAPFSGYIPSGMPAFPVSGYVGGGQGAGGMGRQSVNSAPLMSGASAFGMSSCGGGGDGGRVGVVGVLGGGGGGVKAVQPYAGVDYLQQRWEQQRMADAEDSREPPHTNQHSVRHPRGG